MTVTLIRVVVSSLFAILIVGFGFLAFASSIHNPGIVNAVIQWLTIPFFNMVVVFNIFHSDALAWVGFFLSWVLWSLILFRVLPPLRAFVGKPDEMRR